MANTNSNTKKKLSRPTKFAILVGCLLVAVGAYALAVHIAANEEESTESTETYEFVSVSSDDITKLTWSYEDTEYTLEKNDDGNWIWTDDEDFELDQDTVNGMVSTISAIDASRVLTDVTDYAQYGLDDPESVITFETSDGQEIQIITGDTNEVSSEYYAKRSDDDSVYLVTGDYLSYYEWGAEDIAATDDDEDTESDTTTDTDTESVE